MRQGVQRGRSGLVDGHRAVAAEGQPTFGDAAAAGAGSIFEHKGPGAGRHDPDAEAFDRGVEDDKWLVTRPGGIDRPFCDSFRTCRHRVATEKKTEGTVRNDYIQM